METPVYLEEPEVGRAMERAHGIDGILGGVGYETYGLAFDRASSFLRDVHMRMSREVGWRSAERPLDFEGISGYYPVTGEGRCEVRRGDELVVRFSSGPDGRLAAEFGGEGFPGLGPDASPWHCLSAVMNGALCLEPSNLELAREETHGGREVVFGIRYGDACAFGVTDDGDLRRLLAEREANVRFADPEKFDAVLARWKDTQAGPGFEPADVPVFVTMVYDGRDVMDEDAAAVALGVSTARDRELIAELRREGDALRTELERTVGIPEGSLHFRFGRAVFPSLWMRDDTLSIMHRCNRQAGGFLSAYGGQVALFRGKAGVDRGESRPVRLYDTVADAIRDLRFTVLSKGNVERASLDWEDYVRSLSKTPPPPGGAGGVSI